MRPDVRVERHGSLFSFEPTNLVAETWIDDNVELGAQWLGGRLIVEHRYAYELACGMTDDGLTVE